MRESLGSQMLRYELAAHLRLLYPGLIFFCQLLMLRALQGLAFEGMLQHAPQAKEMDSI